MAENYVSLTGNLGGDPEWIQTKDGKCFSKLKLAVNQSHRDKQGNWTSKSSWFNLICFVEYRQERISLLHKGDMVHITGSLQQSYFDGKDGKKHESVQVVVDEIFKIEKLPSKQNAQNIAQSGFVPQTQQYNQQQAQPQGAPYQPQQQASAPYGQNTGVQQNQWNGRGPSMQPQAPVYNQNNNWNGQR
ncbi:MAG: single-stranded DNA-binding protein [Succinatimonas hippei]|nr:single-stranded DNA-binding protein [Succinatimonas hippei]